MQHRQGVYKVNKADGQEGGRRASPTKRTAGQEESKLAGWLAGGEWASIYDTARTAKHAARARSWKNDHTYTLLQTVNINERRISDHTKTPRRRASDD